MRVSAIVEFDKPSPIKELGLVVMVEKSRDGKKTEIHLEKVRRVQVRSLTKSPKSE